MSLVRKFENKVKFLIKVLSLTMMGSLVQSCGGDDKKESGGDSVSYSEVSFEGAESGQQFVIIPYLLGDPDKIEGGSETVKFTITGTQASGASLTGGSDPSVENFQELDTKSDHFTAFHGSAVVQGEKVEEMGYAELNHQLRTLLNRYDPELGFYQGEWFWNLAKKIDQVLIKQASFNSNSTPLSGTASGFASSNLPLGIGPVEATYLVGLDETFGESGQNPKKFRQSQNLSGQEIVTAPYALNAATCPKAGDSVIMPDAVNPSETDTAIIPASGVVEGTDYCIVYLTAPVSEPSKDSIKKSLETILKVYKKTIYKDDFAASASGFNFKPVVVITDFKDTNRWPSTAAYQVDGAFLPVPSKAAKQPMLYMASDLNKMKARDATLVKSLFHSTLAHEMQHAIMNYYRVQKTNGVLENASIDEGLAHYMEDLFGYGSENFAGFAKLYFDVWTDTFSPVLHASLSESINRGGAQSLWYYLVSQKGGVKFEGGIASGGDGLNYIADVVTNTTQKGPKGLVAKYGQDLTTTIGEFFGAVAVDNTTAPGLGDKLKVQEVQAMKDLQGVDKKYGMRFNNFGGLPATKKFEENKFESGKASSDLTFYSAFPVFYQVSDPAVKIKFKSSSDAGPVAITKVRIK